MSCFGRLSARLKLLRESTCGALERLPTLQLTREIDRAANDLLRATVDTVLSGAIRTAPLGIDDELLRAVMPTARDEQQEVGS